MRLDVLQVERGFDIIIRTSPAAYFVSFAELRVEMNDLLGRLMS